MTSDTNRPGWDSSFPEFEETDSSEIVEQLIDRLPGSSPQQENAWYESIPKLQREVREVLHDEPDAASYWVLCEYELPYESRRPDVIFLMNGAVVVIELKGRRVPSSADIDQASAYARDLRCYHRDCQDRPVHAVLVPTSAIGYRGQESGVHIAGPDALDHLLSEFERASDVPPLTPSRFLDVEAYQPLPTLVAAARHLLQHGDLPRIHRAHANTQPAIDTITAIVHEAHRTRSRRLILLSGVPGAGKTLVGLRIAHADFLDDLAEPRTRGRRSTTPAVYLSGNGPLVEVLQYELRSAGGGGRTFVRGVKDYVKTYTRSPSATPPEHVLIFDEAQRAWDATQVQRKHKNDQMKSEPEAFIEFAERIPGWCVVVALIGSGQEIHVGEEGGIRQWNDAVDRSAQRETWTVHGPPQLAPGFAGTEYQSNDNLSLDVTIRSHAAEKLHEFVAGIIDGREPSELRGQSTFIRSQGYALRITRDIAVAKAHLAERYANDLRARYGILTSSRQIDGPEFGVHQHKREGKWDRIPIGPWFAAGRGDTSSCTSFTLAVSEFEVQGLELEGALVFWGQDFLRNESGVWETRRSRRLSSLARYRDPMQLRKNAYRVLLTRGRDTLLICVPPVRALDRTFEYLCACGFVMITE